MQGIGTPCTSLFNGIVVTPIESGTKVHLINQLGLCKLLQGETHLLASAAGNLSKFHVANVHAIVAEAVPSRSM